MVKKKVKTKTKQKEKGRCWLCPATVTSKSPSIFYAPMGLEGTWVVVCESCKRKYDDCNPVLDQDRAFDLYDTYKKYGYVMFPQQRRIYEHIAGRVAYRSVLEIGCGNGVGSAMLRQQTKVFIATDKLEGNVKFAREMYPWIVFAVLDVSQPIEKKFASDTVVAVEVIEHVADPRVAIANMREVCNGTMWISTPNGNNAKRPPDNPYHVCEYTTREMLEMLPDTGLRPKILAWDDLRELELDTDVSPLIYRVDL